jgi:SHS2 domain-containing protein
MVEIIEHPADVGIKVQSDTLEALFTETMWGMLQFIIDEPSPTAVQSVPIDLKAYSLDKLLIKFLSEVLYIVQDKYLHPHRLEIHRLDKTRISAELFVNPDAKIVGEIKNVTYHHFRLEEIDGKWLCEIIFDL